MVHILNLVTMSKHNQGGLLLMCVLLPKGASEILLLSYVLSQLALTLIASCTQVAWVCNWLCILDTTHTLVMAISVVFLLYYALLQDCIGGN